MIVCGDSANIIPTLADESVDLIVTDPPYGWKFMGKDWDKAVPSVDIWRECLRVLKPGAFAFVMSGPRMDCLSEMGKRLAEAGFETGFTPMFHAYGSGFPKAADLPKGLLGRFSQASLQGVYHWKGTKQDSQSDCPSSCRFCGGSLHDVLAIVRDVEPEEDGVQEYNHPSLPSVSIQVDNGRKHKVSFGALSFHHATPDLQPLSSWQTMLAFALESSYDDWLHRLAADNWGLSDSFPLPVGSELRSDKRLNNGGSCSSLPMLDRSDTVPRSGHKACQSYLYSTRYCPDCQMHISNTYDDMKGSKSGFSPKPAVEVVIVAMKPLAHGTYIDQALDNRKGVTWLDNGRIPYESDDDFSGCGWAKMSKEHIGKPQAVGGDERWTTQMKFLGDFRDRNQGRFPANLLISDDVVDDGANYGKHGGGNPGASTFWGLPSRERKDERSQGGFSRFFSLDVWWQAKLSALPESVQRTFPFLVVPKAGKKEKNLGCEGLPEKESLVSKIASDIEQCARCKGWIDLSISGIHRAQRPQSWCLCDKPIPSGKRNKNLPTKNPHPTVKPLKLMSYLITLGSRPNDLVLDPFAGTCTTGMAAKMLGRNYLMVEIDEQWCRIGRRRVDAVQERLL